jgi:hypothetical protein
MRRVGGAGSPSRRRAASSPRLRNSSSQLKATSLACERGSRCSAFRLRETRIPCGIDLCRSTPDCPHIDIKGDPSKKAALERFRVHFASFNIASYCLQTQPHAFASQLRRSVATGSPGYSHGGALRVYVTYRLSIETVT